MQSHSTTTTGAKWDLSWRHKQQKGHTQLYLLLSAFNPRCDHSAYRNVLESALTAGHSPCIEDRKGRNALFVLCERMACIPLGK